MARYTALTLAALLSLPMYARAARADDVCERQAPQPQAQQGQQQDARNSRGDQGHQPAQKWWLDPQLRQQLSITDAQSKAVDAIWQKSAPPLREGWHRLDGLEMALSQMIQDGADEAAVVAQIEKVENTRAELNKGRTLMIYRMNKVLTPEQRAKVKAMHDANDHRDGRRGGGSR